MKESTHFSLKQMMSSSFQRPQYRESFSQSKSQNAFFMKKKSISRLLSKGMKAITLFFPDANNLKLFEIPQLYRRLYTQASAKKPFCLN
jgi:hypothetical protein